MRAYPLDNPSHAIAAETLAKQGILSWAVPADEKTRTSTIEKIKREHHYVDQDFVALVPDMPNLAEICAKFDKEHYHTEDEVRFVVEGALWQESAAANRNKVLAAGAIVGEDALFSDAAADLDVRALEDSLILELPLARQKELTASCPEIAFALLRAAGAVIAAGGRPCAASDDEVAAN